eukprot:3621701-Amphidinium_carterae.2
MKFEARGMESIHSVMTALLVKRTLASSLALRSVHAQLQSPLQAIGAEMAARGAQSSFNALSSASTPALGGHLRRAQLLGLRLGFQHFLLLTKIANNFQSSSFEVGPYLAFSRSSAAIECLTFQPSLMLLVQCAFQSLNSKYHSYCFCNVYCDKKCLNYGMAQFLGKP